MDNDIKGEIEVVVLEGRDRVGGRVNTTFWDGCPIDLGASWLHDHEEDHPLSIMAETLNLRLKNTLYGDGTGIDLNGNFVERKKVDKG